MANVKSLADLNSEDEDDDGRQHNDYYAGGKASGQLIRGAPEEKDSDDEDDRVGSLFARAKKVGATQGTAEDLQQPGGAFKGAARTLAGGEAPSAPQQAGPRNHVITFYNNNIFTVDDGPARRVDDPANFRFIESISKGECPDELDPGVTGAPVTVNLVRKEEAYSEAEKPKYSAFQGSGRTLGSSAPAAGSGASTSGSQGAEGEWEGVDESKPVTSLQLRLADGSRMVARFNTHHHITDIRRFIRASRPDTMGPYQLMTAFPNQLIENENQSLEAAGLLNAVIIQKR